MRRGLMRAGCVDVRCVGACSCRYYEDVRLRSHHLQLALPTTRVRPACLAGRARVGVFAKLAKTASDKFNIRDSRFTSHRSEICTVECSSFYMQCRPKLKLVKICTHMIEANRNIRKSSSSARSSQRFT